MQLQQIEQINPHSIIHAHIESDKSYCTMQSKQSATQPSH